LRTKRWAGVAASAGSLIGAFGRCGASPVTSQTASRNSSAVIRLTSGPRKTYASSPSSTVEIAARDRYAREVATCSISDFRS